MNLTYDPITLARHLLKTPLNAICVKRETMPAFGRISKPPITHGEVASNSELWHAVLESGVPEVVVVGHCAMPILDEFFVWTGTPDEFVSNWRGD